jgi:hypothetical protein
MKSTKGDRRKKEIVQRGNGKRVMEQQLSVLDKIIITAKIFRKKYIPKILTFMKT